MRRLRFFLAASQLEPRLARNAVAPSDARARKNVKKCPILSTLREVNNCAHKAGVTLEYQSARNLEPDLSNIHASADRSQTHRSRITNGKELLANVDGRTAAALRVVALLTSRAKGVYQV